MPYFSNNSVTPMRERSGILNEIARITYYAEGDTQMK